MSLPATPVPAKQPTPFEYLRSRVVDIYWRWRTWKRLFMSANKGGGEAKMELLNRSAASFFGLVEDTLILDVVLRLWKLVDPHAKSLTFQTLLKTNPFSIPATELDKARGICAEYNREIATVTKWRHKRVAHQDHDVALQVRPMATLKFADIEAALAKAIEFMETISQDKTYHYDWLVEIGGPNELFRTLIWAERYVQQARENDVAVLSDDAEFDALKD